MMRSSFRDPGGRLLEVDGRILRIITRQGASHFQSFLASSVGQRPAVRARIVRTTVLEGAEVQDLLENPDVHALVDGMDLAMLVEHERVPFPSFPHEWSPELLHAAAELTLDLSEGLLSDHLGLKDATPYNILFRGPEPLFIDVLSVEQRNPGDAIWLPYAQFLRTFIIPLLLHKYFKLSPGLFFLTRRDGLEPEEMYRLCSPFRRLMPPFLTLVSIPKWLGGTSRAVSPELYRRKADVEPERALFILGSVFRRLRRVLKQVAPRESQRSSWTGYMAEMTHYTKEQFAAKQAFVEDAVRLFHPGTVLDVGCNTGFFSCLVAKNGARVVGIDSDPMVLGDVWRSALKERLDVLPLVVDLARPTPPVGWQNRECPSFLERARGAFDAVLMLAVIHHMLVSERIPLQEIVDLAADLTRDIGVVEFIDPQDIMFQRLTRGREELFTGLTREMFESAWRRRFEIVRSQQIEDTHRRLYLMRKIQ